MTEVISVRFKSCGKNYFFDPAGIAVNKGDKVIVETAKGLELAECTYGNHSVEDTAVVQPLRPVVRKASEYDLKSAEQSKAREKEAFGVCRTKIEEHGLDMKLVDVECSFDGSKTTFFFTSDGRVDFRELVKDLAGVFHNRIELRQIGVRDEAKMIGGIGICGRPYCCHQFLDEFAPVSTKMAKVQSLSLNPTKISGSCGRLMCCLRYEEEAYEDLLTKVPKQGAYVETADGYGVATQINLLRQTVKVSLDKDSDETVHLYQASEIAVVPGGRPKEGEEAPHVLEEKKKEAEEQTAEDEEEIKTLFSGGRIYSFADNKQPENENLSSKESLQDSRLKNLQEKVQNSQTPSGPAQTDQPETQDKSDSANADVSEAPAKKNGSHRRYNRKRRGHGNNSEEVRQNGKSPETDKDGKSQKESSHGKSEKKDPRRKSDENAEKTPGDHTKESNKPSGNSRNRYQKGHSKQKNESKNTAPEKTTGNREPAAEPHENSEKKQPQKNNHNYRKKYYRKPRSNGAPKTDNNDKAQPKQNLG